MNQNFLKKTDDEIKNLQYQTEKHDHEKILKSLKIKNESYREKYKNLNKEKVLLIITEILLGSGSAITTSTTSLINPNIGIVLPSSTALLTSIGNISTNEYFIKLKIRYTKLGDWIVVVTLVYEKTLETSTVDKKVMRKNHWN